MANYLPILILIVLAFLFASLSFAASGLLAPKRKTAAKIAPYECGIVPTKEPAERFPVRFYLVAMIFIVFDIEVIFVFPWALAAKELSTFGLVEMITFAGVVIIPFAYLISHGALDWGPIKRANPQTLNEERTTNSTVQRIKVVPSTVSSTHEVASDSSGDAA